MSTWYYEFRGEAEGPVDESTLRNLIENDVVTPDTQVWHDGMDDWQRAGSVPGLFDNPPPLSSRPSEPSESSELSGASSSPPPPSSEHTTASPAVESHMAKAILSTLFCCLPLGVVAIINASRVSTALSNGNDQEAREYSAKADKWGNVSIVVGLIVGVLYFFIGLAGA